MYQYKLVVGTLNPDQRLIDLDSSRVVPEWLGACRPQAIPAQLLNYHGRSVS